MELSVDCGCAVLACEDDLSDVDSKECDCEDCLEAKIEACTAVLGNESSALNEYEESKKRGTGHNGRHHERGKHEKGGQRNPNGIPLRDHNDQRTQQDRTVHCHGRWAGKVNTHQRTVEKRIQHRPVKRRQTQVPLCSRSGRERFVMSYHPPDSPQIPDLPELLPEQLDVKPQKPDYNESQMMLFVNRRIQQNLLKHQRKKVQERLGQLEEQERRKQNLEQLRLIAQILAKNAVSTQKLPEKEKKPWNYTEQQPEVHPEPCCHKIPLKPKVDTKNYSKQQLERKQFLKSIYKRIKEEMRAHKRQRRQSQPCNYHEHPKRDLSPKEIDTKIQENAKKALQDIAQQQKKKKDQQKLRDAKLRGLALEAQAKLNKAKRQGTKDRPEFKIQLEAEKLKQQKQKQKENQNKQQSEQQQQGGPGSTKPQAKKSGDRGKMNSTKKSSKGNLGRSGQQELNQQVGASDKGTRVANPDGKFYVWDVPIRQGQVEQVFQSNKKPPKAVASFKEQAEKHIRANQQKKVQKSISKTRQQQLQQKIQRKKAEMQKEFSTPTLKQHEPSLVDIPHMRKDMIKRM